jgi:cysteine desulfurase / selenocysteine lyase
MTTFPVDKIREGFPALHQEVNGRPLVYFDNAATTQKPVEVIRAIDRYYEKDNCNIHRGVHHLSIRATEAYEETRKEVAGFINATSPREIIFTRGTTEAVNLVAYSFGKKFLREGDEVIITVMEHHSNFVPWQQVCLERGATLRFVPLNSKGELLLDDLWRMMSKKTKLIALAHASNVLGTITPVKEIIRRAHELNIPVLVDGAQAVAHLPVDMQDLDADFYCFSGHKMYGPMGIGVLYGKERLLEELPPYQLGGEMIKEVFFDRTTFNELPFKFEAGTPNVEGVTGLREALKFLQSTGLNRIGAYETELLNYATGRLLSVPGLRIFGTSPHKASLISFLIGDIHPYDAGTLIDQMGIALRTGHHCAMPLMEYLQISGTVRASFACYNTFEEVDRLYDALVKVKEMLG